MKHSMGLVAAFMAALLALGTGAGCTLGPKATGGSGASATPPVKIGSPAVGTHALDPFIPFTAMSFADGIASLGEQNSAAKSTAETATIPAILRPVAGGKGLWDVTRIGSVFRFVSGAAELGSTRVVVGTNPPNRVPGKDEVPWVGVSEKGGPYAIEELGKSLFGGRSTEFRGVSSTGNTLDPESVFMVVGGVEREKGLLVGNPSGTDPFALVSQDGKTWTKTTDLPLPAGVTGAMAWAVTYAPSSTAYPGTIVVGQGWDNVTSDNILGEQVGIVWYTADQGKSWKVISDDNFFHDGRDFSPSLVAADDSNIVVAGWADAQGQIGSKVSQKQTESIEWYAGSDGVWHIISDGKSLRAARSSMTTALVARKDAGFLSASEIYDTATGPYSPGGQMRSNPVARVFASPDAENWNLISDSITDMDKSAVVDGIAEFADRDAFFGIDTTVHAKAWVADRAKVK